MKPTIVYYSLQQLETKLEENLAALTDKTVTLDEGTKLLQEREWILDALQAYRNGEGFVAREEIR